MPTRPEAAPLEPTLDELRRWAQAAIDSVVRYHQDIRDRRVAPLTTSIGENACTCIEGTRALTARTYSAYPVTGSSGSIPPCIHTSVAPATWASQARSATSVTDSEKASASSLRCAKAQKRQPV